MKPNGKHYTEPERVEQRIEALRLWMSGAKYATIAKRLDVSASTAYSRVQDAIDEMRPHADFDAYRATQLSELAIARHKLRAVIATWQPMAEIDGYPVVMDHRRLIDTIRALIDVQNQEAKLVGLDRVSTPIDEISEYTDDELEALITEWSTELSR